MMIPRACGAAATLYTLVTGGYNDTINMYDFDGTTITETARLKVPSGPTWVEPYGNTTKFYTLSENDKILSSLELDGSGNATVTGQLTLPDTAAGCVHIHYYDNQLSVSSYGSGAAVYIPLSDDGVLSDATIPQVSTFPWAYANQTAPLPERQLHPYGHGSIHTDDGAFWITDLGSDTVWKYDPPEVGTNNFSLGVEYKVPEGFGPRHLATPDGKNVYAIGEMSNQVIALSEGNTATDPVSILPAGLSEEYGQYMGGGEIQAHPTVPTTLYASNRNQRLITEKVPDYVAPEGDTVTILQVTEAGKAPEVIAQIETKCDHIRGMKISPDGKYVAVGGMNNNKMEVYAISGDNMEEWTLVATQEVLQIADITFFPK